ncbi:MAG: hypothetical protein J6M18_00825 [Actinomycetaceae bacterium]|nr:hypothetical protein [Actinomycetaceae bacterium]
MRDFFEGIFIAWRKPIVIFVTNCAIAISLFTFAMSFSSLNMQVQELVSMNALRARNAVVFERTEGLAERNTFESEDEFAQWKNEHAFTEDELSVLEDALNEGRSYVYSSVAIDQEELMTTEEETAVIVSGEKLFNEIFSYNMLCHAPCAMVGKNINIGEYAELSVGSQVFPIVETELSGTWAQPFWPRESLESMIVLVVDPSGMKDVDSLYVNDMLSNAVFVDLSDEDIEMLLTKVSEKFPLYLVPVSLKSAQSTALDETITIDVMMVVTSVGFIGVFILGIFLIQWELLKKRRTDFLLRVIYGASKKRVFMRMVGFVASYVFFIPCVLFGVLALLDPILRSVLLVELLVLVCVVLVISYVFYIRLGVSEKVEV